MSTPVDHFAGPRADLFRCHTRGQRWVCPVLRTLKENLLWVRYFATVEELRLALLEFKRVYTEILKNLKSIQLRNGLPPSDALDSETLLLYDIDATASRVIWAEV